MDSLDNSEFSRNGDYSPNRLDAQMDACQALFAAKRRGNVESQVAVMACDGLNCAKVLMSLSVDQRKLVSALSALHPSGTGQPVDTVVPALKVAQIILNTRPNPNQRQRIVLFLASPLVSDHDLVGMAKLLRKNNVAVDVVACAGADGNAHNRGLLEQFINAVNVGEEVDDGDRVSRLLVVNPGESIVELVSAQLCGSSSSSHHAAAGGSGDFEADEDMDPELAMALKMSLEEEMARQAGNSAKNDTDVAMDEQEEEDPELAKAIAMSLEKN